LIPFAQILLKFLILVLRSIFSGYLNNYMAFSTTLPLSQSKLQQIVFVRAGSGARGHITRLWELLRRLRALTTFPHIGRRESRHACARYAD
jgi:hypothetical protein